MNEKVNAQTKLRNHQLKAIEALKIVDRICNQYNIEYFLIAGSVLGAVRHKGFIPWDDDIDIGMRIPEFNKFKKIVVNELGNKFSWSHSDTDSTFASLTGKISYNDEFLLTIFPIVKLGRKRWQSRSQWFIRKVFSPIYQRKVKYIIPKEKRTFKNMFAYYISRILSCFFTKNMVLKILRWNENRFENEVTDYYINLYSKYSMRKETIRVNWINCIKKIKFENGIYPVFCDHHEYLTHLYGDYMVLPPKHKRVPPHLLKDF